jgi:hypothetical protein
MCFGITPTHRGGDEWKHVSGRHSEPSPAQNRLSGHNRQTVVVVGSVLRHCCPKKNEYKPKLNEMNVSLLYPLPQVGHQLPGCQAKIVLSFAKKEKTGSNVLFVML